MAALTRKFLTTLGIEDDKADAVIDKHTEVVNEIKTERDQYREDAEKLSEVQKQLNEYQEAEKNKDKDPYKVKYEALKEEFNTYKQEIANKEIKAKKEEAYKQLLKAAGVSEKRIEAVLKVSDVDMLEFDDEGKVKDSDKLTESIKNEWSDFIQTSSIAGASTATPPTNPPTDKKDLGKMSMEDYIKARKEM